MTDPPPKQETNKPAYRTISNRRGRFVLSDAIETWRVDRQLRSYRKTAVAVCSNYETVRDQIRRINALLDSGEIEIVGGEIRERDTETQKSAG